MVDFEYRFDVESNEFQRDIILIINYSFGMNYQPFYYLNITKIQLKLLL